MKWIIFIAVSISFLFSSQAQTTVKLKVNGVTELSGNLMVAVYKNASKFPEFGKGDINVVHKVKSNNPIIHLDNLTIGKTYAIAIFHDANSNQYLDKNFLGMPVEKYGFSNDARGTFGPPYFEEAQFKVTPDQFISITIQ